MNKVNYAKELEKYIEEKQSAGIYPRLLLHACCAPCSSYCLEYLRQYFDVTLFYYNPNITSEPEYRKRVEEEIRLITEFNRQVEEGRFDGMNSDGNARKINFLEGDYDPGKWLEAVRGFEDCPEGGDRCIKCFELRMNESARVCKELGFDGFTTTLTISTLKNADNLNRAGREAADRYGTFFLPSDFKKKNGYKRSIELSKLYGLYRQDYCGCSFSKAQREREKEQRENV
jgi:predicted adenine nucleotide alpha hydrolase (AANH) superfamily ATPase